MLKLKAVTEFLPHSLQDFYGFTGHLRADAIA
jgi:hypothetical protein